MGQERVMWRNTGIFKVETLYGLSANSNFTQPTLPKLGGGGLKPVTLCVEGKPATHSFHFGFFHYDIGGCSEREL